MSKHTPGPWAQQNPVSPKIISIAKHDGIDGNAILELIATVNVVSWKGTTPAEGKREALANARLIAAAPDTYDCTKDGDEVEDIFLREWQTALGPDVALSDEAQTRLHQLRQKRHVAIAKAEGSDT